MRKPVVALLALATCVTPLAAARGAGPIVHAENETTALPRSPTEIARLGKRAFVQWDCAVLASIAGESAEHERLYALGMASGKSFLLGARQYSGSKEELAEALNKELPMLFTFVMSGPSDDFILGRLWEATLNYETDELIRVRDGHTVSDLELKQRAANAFMKGNCAQL